MSDGLRGFIKLRVDPRDKFPGKENFEEFAKRPRAYVILADPALAILMDDAARTNINKSITYADIYQINFGTGDSNERTPEERAELAQLLYSLLTTTLKDAPYLLLETITDSNGPEAWRLLVKRYEKNQSHLAMITYSH